MHAGTYRVAAINPDFFLLSFKWDNTSENHPILLKKKKLGEIHNENQLIQ
jgi:hypothetical protein